MDVARLFVETVDWLDEIGKGQPPEYGLLMASGRLRLLLLDDSPLVHQVNRHHRLKVRFRILRHGDPPMKEALKLWAVPDGLSPDIAPAGHRIPIEEVNLDTFLRERIMIIDGTDVTVVELIRHLANVAGGVHAGSARDPVDRQLEEMGELMMLQGVNVVARCLRGIVQVVVSALRPLREAAMTSLGSATDQSPSSNGPRSDAGGE